MASMMVAPGARWQIHAYRKQERSMYLCFALLCIQLLLLPCLHAFTVAPLPWSPLPPATRGCNFQPASIRTAQRTATFSSCILFSSRDRSNRRETSQARIQEQQQLQQQLQQLNKNLESNIWFPRVRIEDDDIYKVDESLSELQDRAVALAANLVRARLQKLPQGNKAESMTNASATENNTTTDHGTRMNCTAWQDLVRGRFMDLTCTAEGESSLEDLFFDEPEIVAAAVAPDHRLDVIRGAVMILQSLCAMGTQVGVTGLPQKLRQMVAHLDDRYDLSLVERDLLETWDRDSVRRLKYRIDRSPALALMEALLRKRTANGAHDLLVDLGVWKKHEDLALLRSGFPLRFTEEEEEIARKAFNATKDPDTILGIRKDFRNMKVYTIDSASTSEIDDGLSIETVRRPDGSEIQRVWIHIADADHWAPRNSSLLEIARQRITSLYLPTGPIPMFPEIISSDLMSLKANSDSYALSLGVELNDDGSIDPISVVVTPSIIRVTYRLTYDEVDEMLSEGIGFNEEWELGALLSAATKRRNYRIANGSTEGVVPNPIPYGTISTFPAITSPDGTEISLNVQVSHNAGKNQSTGAEDDGNKFSVDASVSSANLLVTEAMILSGESVGHWKSSMEDGELNGAGDTKSRFTNLLRLPFRTQPEPDFKSRSQERTVMMDLMEYNVGGGYCHAWYARRFLQPVKVSETRLPHSGLGLTAYVQWTSPIRRFGDLQVHAAVKRFIRRNRVYELISSGQTVPSGLTASDLGLRRNLWNENGTLSTELIEANMLDHPNYGEGLGLSVAAKMLQRQSEQYWLYEYVRRKKESDPERTYEVVILGCIDTQRGLYAVYVYDLGLEHRFTCSGRSLTPGVRLSLRVDSVSPRNGVLSFVRAF